MPIGMSRRGFLDSCAAVLTASKPRNANDTTAAPRNTPDMPNSPSFPVLAGTNGWKFSAFTYFQPRITNINITDIFSTTIIVLTIELPSIPRMRNMLITITIPAAGRFIIPPSQGHAQSSGGRKIPMCCRKTLKYRLQLMLTVVAATVYSNTKSQPIIHAISSPIVA